MRTPSISRLTATAGILAVSALSMAFASPVRDGRNEREVEGARDPRKIALMIGVADYEHMGARPTATNALVDLQGPENDVAAIRATLATWGFDQDADMRTLIGPQATKAGMEAGFQWLATRATDSTDAVVIYFSGHGSHAPDGADKDEPDGRDEGLVPFDAKDAHDAKQLLLDDQIRGYLAALKTQNVTIIIDACYSGTVTRGEGDADARSKGPMPIQGGAPDHLGANDFTEARGHTLITASRSDQVAQELRFDMDGKKVWMGALTNHLTRALNGAAGAKGLRYDELIDRVRADVRGALLPQVPQLEGDKGAVIFRSNQRVAARPFVLVSAAPGNRVTLDAGAVHGVRRTAVYDVHGAGELQFDARPIAQVMIDSVEATRAFGHLVDERRNKFTGSVQIPARARAVPSLVPVGAPALQKLAVYVHPTAAALAPQIRADSSRFVLSDSVTAVATVTRRRGVPEVLVRGIPLPPQPSDSKLETVFEGTSVSGYDPASLSCPLLRALSISNMERLVNPAPPADLSVLARVVPAGSGPPKTDQEKTDTIYIGEPVDIYAKVGVTADIAHISKVYLTAALAGYTSNPAVLYPPSDPTPAELNKWFPIMRGVSVEEPGGSEIIKLVVNSDPYDLTPLVESFGRCDVRSGGKNTWTSTVAPVKGWTAISHRIDILSRR